MTRTPAVNEQLLLVEAADAIDSAMRMHLKGVGYRLHRGADGRQAMPTIAVQRSNLMLLDVMLPGADGWKVCRQLRAHHADGPIIMLSVRSSETHRVLGLASGADGDLAKLFLMLELVARVRALLRRVSQLRASVSVSVSLAARDRLVGCWVLGVR